MEDLQLIKPEIWNVPTLKSREIIEHNLEIRSLKGSPMKSPPKSKKKSLWSKVKSVMTCTTYDRYIVNEDIMPEKNETDELKRLNELRLLTLSYEAEMAELKEEISQLTKERAKLKAQRSCKVPPSSPTHSIESMGRVSSSSGFSEMSTLELRPMSLASTMQRLEDAKILYIC